MEVTISFADRSTWQQNNELSDPICRSLGWFQCRSWLGNEEKIQDLARNRVMATRRQDLIQTYIHMRLIFCISFTELISSLSSFLWLIWRRCQLRSVDLFPHKTASRRAEETASTSVEQQTQDYRLTECSVTALINFLLSKSLNLLFELQRIR